jgi:hypothetical protein
MPAIAIERKKGAEHIQLSAPPANSRKIGCYGDLLYLGDYSRTLANLRCQAKPLVIPGSPLSSYPLKNSHPSPTGWYPAFWKN